jgi:peptidyl-prolyl cis-trans isomerase C
MKKLFLAAAAACYVSLGYVPMSFARAEDPKAAPVSDVIARVGDQTITFSEINTALNSSAIVGVSLPALGTPERDTVRITLLDRFVSGNLLYLDARKRGLDQDPAYLREMERFDNAILAGLYQEKELIGDISVTEEEIQAFFAEVKAADAELTPDIRPAIEASVRSQKTEKRLEDAKGRIRDGVEVVIHEETLSVSGDKQRADAVVVAEIDGQPLTWGALKDRIVVAGKGAVMADPLASEQDARRQALDAEIDLRIMASKARAAGLDQDRLFKARSGEFHKTRLINLHRERLVEQMEPTDEELKAYYEANKATIVEPEARKIQMVVLKTKDEAEDVKARIDAGGMTMYQAARDHSIAPKAKDDLGEVGWVYQGDTVPALDEAVFALGPGEASNPVETPAGWHLVMVQDVREARFTGLDDNATRKLTRRRYLDEKLNEYVVALRQDQFTVEVYEDVLVRLAQQEADMVKEMGEKAEESSSVTQQRIEELQKLINPPR